MREYERRELVAQACVDHPDRACEIIDAWALDAESRLGNWMSPLRSAAMTYAAVRALSRALVAARKGNT